MLGMLTYNVYLYIYRYSSPSIGVGPGDRNILRSVNGGVLFFAGEHTNVYVNSALQGAMQTGRRAATDVAAALHARHKAQERAGVPPSDRFTFDGCIHC
jgi:hypothetical protein